MNAAKNQALKRTSLNPEDRQEESSQTGPKKRGRKPGQLNKKTLEKALQRDVEEAESKR